MSLEGSFAPALDFRLTLKGETGGVVRVVASATARADILTNRTGLCLLHPLSCVGARVEIEHDDGRVSRSTFPARVPPWPPFMGIRAIRHEYARGLWAECRFEGDVFEFEDQRNNADASFKTYSRSNMAPRPYTLRASETVRQSLTLGFDPPRRRTRVASPSPVRVTIGGPARPLPPLGIEFDPKRDIAALRPSFLHVCLRPSVPDPDWTALAEYKLRLDIEVADAAELPARLASLRGLAPDAVAVFPSTRTCLDLARAAFPGAKIGGGTPHYFVQLNRAEGMGRVDFKTFTVCPIVHGAEDSDIMLGLRALPSMLASLRGPVRVGPSGIAARRSPLGALAPTDGTKRVALAGDDPRARGSFGAAWLLGHVVALADSGARTISLVAPLGPAADVFARLATGRRRRKVTVSEPEKLAAVALDGDLLLANLTDRPLAARGLEIAPYSVVSLLARR